MTVSRWELESLYRGLEEAIIRSLPQKILEIHMVHSLSGDQLFLCVWSYYFHCLFFFYLITNLCDRLSFPPAGPFALTLSLQHYKDAAQLSREVEHCCSDSVTLYLVFLLIERSVPWWGLQYGPFSPCKDTVTGGSLLLQVFPIRVEKCPSASCFALNLNILMRPAERT